jgi:hypothetical protein
VIEPQSRLCWARVPRDGRLVGQIDAEAVRVVVEAAPTEWVLLIKLDTLPYRSGHASWLADAMEVIERNGLFGMTAASWPDPKQLPLEPDYVVTQESGRAPSFSGNDGLKTPAHCLRAMASKSLPTP